MSVYAEQQGFRIGNRWYLVARGGLVKKYASRTRNLRNSGGRRDRQSDRSSRNVECSFDSSHAGTSCLSDCNLWRALPESGEEADRPGRQVWSACVHCTLQTTEAYGRLCLCAHVIWLLSDAARVSYQSTVGPKCSVCLDIVLLPAAN